jgi:hypothetical protein
VYVSASDALSIHTDGDSGTDDDHNAATAIRMGAWDVFCGCHTGKRARGFSHDSSQIMRISPDIGSDLAAAKTFNIATLYAQRPGGTASFAAVGTAAWKMVHTGGGGSLPFANFALFLVAKQMLVNEYAIAA